MLRIGRLSLLLIFLFSLCNSSWAQYWSYFNNVQDKSFTEPYRKIKRKGVNFEDIIVKSISSAKERVWVAVQELTLPNISHALVKLHNKGVDVKVVIENSYNVSFSQLDPSVIREMDDYYKGKYWEYLRFADGYGNRNGSVSSTEKRDVDALYILREAGVPIIDDTADGSQGSGLMHHKFIVIDDDIILTSSANFTHSGFFGDWDDFDTRGNANGMVIIDNYKVNDAFAEEFQIMWGETTPWSHFRGSLFGSKKPYRSPKFIRLSNGRSVTVQFSPHSSNLPWSRTTNGLIANVLYSAKSSILFSLFVFSEQRIANVMKLKHAEDNVQISGFIEPSFAYRYYSELLDMLGIWRPDGRCLEERDNQMWDSPLRHVGIVNTRRGDKLHHKFAVVDDRYVIFGSHNWSASANTNNDETLLVLEGNDVANDFKLEWRRLQQNAVWGVPSGLMRKIKKEQSACQEY